MFDHSTLLNDVYAIGASATFVQGEIEASITVIDDTRPKSLPAGSFADVRGMGPGAFARIPELVAAGITQDDWMDAGLNFNGRTWIVRSYEMRGSPNGEDQGEVRFLLKAGNA